MITSFATVRTMMSICDIFMKTLYAGITTNYTQKNRGMGFALCLCNTKAKLAIKQNVTIQQYFKLLFSDAFALECRDRRPRRSATVRPKILSSQGYLWTVEDAGPYGFIFTLTAKPQFDERLNSYNRILISISKRRK